MVNEYIMSEWYLSSYKLFQDTFKITKVRIYLIWTKQKWNK